MHRAPEPFKLGLQDIPPSPRRLRVPSVPSDPTRAEVLAPYQPRFTTDPTSRLPHHSTLVTLSTSTMDAITAYLPQAEGYLPKWLLFVSYSASIELTMLPTSVGEDCVQSRLRELDELVNSYRSG